MIKTKRMLEVESKLDKPLEEFLRIKYIKEKRQTAEIARELGVASNGTIFDWLKRYNIKTRNLSETKLRIGVVKPSKKNLKELYMGQRRSAKEIARQLGVVSQTIRNWLTEYNIKMRGLSEVRLPKDFSLPSKNQLKKWYVNERKTTTEIGKMLGIGQSTASRLLKSYNIRVRDQVESQLKKGIYLPTKKELKRLYINERKSQERLAKKFKLSMHTISKLLRKYQIPVRGVSEARLPKGFVKPTKEQLEEWLKDGRNYKDIGKRLNVSDAYIRLLSKEYGIRINNKIKTNSQFINFLKNDEAARNLAGIAVSLNGQSIDIEEIISDIYEDKFKDRNYLHKLLEENTEKIYNLIRDGLTNLGFYLGEFDIGDRTIVPVLIEQAVINIPEDKITISLEERLVKILRNVYSPRFNENSERTIEDIEDKINSSQGKLKSLYKNLSSHYKEVLMLGEELS